MLLLNGNNQHDAQHRCRHVGGGRGAQLGLQQIRAQRHQRNVHKAAGGKSQQRYRLADHAFEQDAADGTERPATQ